MENIRINQNISNTLPSLPHHITPNEYDKDHFKKTLEKLTPPQHLPSKIPAPVKIEEHPIQKLPSTYKAKNLKEFQQIQNYTSPPENKSIPHEYTRKTQEIPLSQQIKLYKEDQFLTNPGGDNYFIRNGKVEYDQNYDHGNFAKRIGKDVSDSFANLNNAVLNSLFGAEYRYVDKSGSLQTAKKTGVLSAVGKFVKNVFEGVYGKPETDKTTPNALDKLAHMGKKIVVDGIAKNLFMEVPQNLINVTENLFLGTLNALEIIPDATIGNFEDGRKLTTKIFDNSQIAINYISDVLPSGEAWMRVHALGTDKNNRNLPILFNIKSPQQGLDDLRWESVRNTPFRKVIETIGSITADILFMP